MKLCKDCKHSKFPFYIPGVGISMYPAPMCDHPDARRSVVTGDLEVTCAVARGQTTIINSCRDVICGGDAKLFEERPPAPQPEPMRPYEVVRVDVEKKRGWWERILGG